MVVYSDHGTGHLNHLNSEQLKVYYSVPHCSSDPHCGQKRWRWQLRYRGFYFEIDTPFVESVMNVDVALSDETNSKQLSSWNTS